MKEHTALLDGKEELKAGLSSLLACASTVKRLREIWPEGEAYFPFEQATSRSLVPVETIATVNALMGLKPVVLETV